MSGIIVRNRILLILGLGVGMIFISACTGQPGGRGSWPQRAGDGPPAGNDTHFDRDFRNMNLTDEERRVMMEEMQQSAIDACSGKSPGDECELQNMRGMMNGTCELRDDDLACQFQRPGAMR